MFELTDEVIKKMAAAGYPDAEARWGVPVDGLLPEAKEKLYKRIRAMAEALLAMIKADEQH